MCDYHKKQYKAIACILKESKTKPEIAKRLVQLFENDNRLFDIEKFSKASGTTV